jgi:hypothetical protein
MINVNLYHTGIRDLNSHTVGLPAGYFQGLAVQWYAAVWHCPAQLCVCVRCAAGSVKGNTLDMLLVLSLKAETCWVNAQNVLISWM